MTTVITRFAPSPTGDLHIGGLRTALYSYLFAKKHGGKFVLRIEDTDQARYKQGSVDTILQSFKWAGIDYDNPNRIVYQSKRTEIYKKYADELIKNKHAYYCFCTPETLKQMRTEQMEAGEAAKYDRRCLKLTGQEIQEKIKNNEPYVIRLKIPQGKTEFTDIIRGEIEIDNKEIDDQILMKSDGFPTYHLANVVDDYEMKITHVIRAEEWLPSTPKHIILYSALSWQVPEFAHVPMVLAPDKSKLSKRHGAVSVLEFKKMGYLPEALVNYLALLGWNPGDEREIFSLEELVKEFDLKKVHSAGAIFDINKLEWMNGHYIREMDIDELVKLCKPYLKNHDDNYIKKVVALEQDRLKEISDITETTEYFFKDPEYKTELLKWRKADLADAKEKLKFLIKELKSIPETGWTLTDLKQLILDSIKANKFQNGNVLWPMRVALTGKDKSPGPFEVAEVLGKDESLKRLGIAVKKLA